MRIRGSVFDEEGGELDVGCARRAPCACAVRWCLYAWLGQRRLAEVREGWGACVYVRAKSSCGERYAMRMAHAWLRVCEGRGAFPSTRLTASLNIKFAV